VAAVRCGNPQGQMRGISSSLFRKRRGLVGRNALVRSIPYWWVTVRAMARLEFFWERLACLWPSLADPKSECVCDLIRFVSAWLTDKQSGRHGTFLHRDTENKKLSWCRQTRATRLVVSRGQDWFPISVL